MLLWEGKGTSERDIVKWYLKDDEFSAVNPASSASNMFRQQWFRCLDISYSIKWYLAWMENMLFHAQVNVYHSAASENRTNFASGFLDFMRLFEEFFSSKLIWPCTRHVRAVQRSNIHLHGYLMLFNHTIKMIVWSINMHTLQPTQENTAWTKQIEHCHSVAKHSLRLHTHHKIYSCSAPTFQCNGKRQEREGISFIIIKIDVGHLMGKLLFHGEIANRTHQVKGKGRAITLTR